VEQRPPPSSGLLRRPAAPAPPRQRAGEGRCHRRGRNRAPLGSFTSELEVTEQGMRRHTLREGGSFAAEGRRRERNLQLDRDDGGSEISSSLSPPQVNTHRSGLAEGRGRSPPGLRTTAAVARWRMRRR
jgi:hypothetical protein